MQTGSPGNTGKSGASVWGREFEDQFHGELNTKQEELLYGQFGRRLEIAAASPRSKRKMNKIMQAVMKHVDAKGRIFSQPFMKLPTRRELPDYYEVIKRPIDIHKINQRLNADKYQASATKHNSAKNLDQFLFYTDD